MIDATYLKAHRTASSLRAKKRGPMIGTVAHMQPGLARWKPEDILTAREIRQFTLEALDCFSPPRDPRILPRPTREFAYLYMWIGCQCVAIEPRTDAPGV